MASINDVFNQLVQANTNLGQIHADGIAETNAINQVKSSVDKLDVDVKAGFNATVAGLVTLAKIEVEIAKLVFHLTQQADTMICALEHISQNSCELVTQSTLQTRLQTSLRDDTQAIRAITELAHPEAALHFHANEELRKQLERCCPPEQPGPACTYRPCPHPDPIRMPDLPKVEDPKPPQPPR